MDCLIKKVNSSLKDMPITYAWRGHGSAIFLELGDLNKVQRKNHPKGEFSVMLDCDWRIENKNLIQCGSFCEAEEIEEAIQSLVGDSIAHLETIGDLKELVLVLNSGRKVVSFTSVVGDPEWCLFLPNKMALGAKNGEVFSENA